MTYTLPSLTPYESQQRMAKDMISHRVPIQRTSWQSTSAPSPAHELQNVLLEFLVPDSLSQWQERCNPDLPWAEDHFQERVSGIPHNPPPSSKDWPWYSQKERERFVHGTAGKFDHTYPERYWPEYGGQLEDVAHHLRYDPWSRQAYLPVWFPEDTGVCYKQRVPCSLGYHFIRNGGTLDCNYFIRSCDLTRHYLNDVYMTGRLMQWMVENVQDKEGLPYCGILTMFVSNMHLFTADTWRFQ